MRFHAHVHRKRRRGASLLELMVVLAILIVAVSIFSQIVTSTAQVRSISRERTLAAEAARKLLERMRNEDLDEVFDLYNASPEDDPGGAGTAPGHRFAVRGLAPTEDSPDGLVGEVVFPAEWQELDDGLLDDPDVQDALDWGGVGEAVEVVGVGPAPQTSGRSFAMEGLWMLREDVDMPKLGMPRDLNGDNVVDEVDHRYDAMVIPVLVRIRWAGKFGERSLELATLLTDFEMGGA